MRNALIIFILVFIVCAAGFGVYNIINSINIFRVKVVESGTISWAKTRNNIYMAGDTVWVNLSDHFIGDTSNTAIKCVILEEK